MSDTTTSTADGWFAMKTEMEKTIKQQEKEIAELKAENSALLSDLITARTEQIDALAQPPEDPDDGFY